MTTKTCNRQFIDSVIREIIQPGTDRLMESRYFSDLRAGKLTARRIQGFALQHYIHNMGILKAFALGATQHAADNRAFTAYATAMGEELTHPNMCKTLGFSLGLTEKDFEKAVPVRGALVHTAACIHGIFLVSVAEMRAMALSNETMVQRYAAEFDEYLSKDPYNMSEEAREFFIVHKGADIEHTERAAAAIAESVTSDEDQEKIRTMCRNMAGFKLGKFDSIYDEYTQPRG
jgi:pyrroloquinoline quinone (PQQ) biosynthesis protein C